MPSRLAAARFPTPRLTGLGTGLLASVAMLGFGCLDSLLFSGSPATYGVSFLLVCVGCGLWVRPAELFTAPVAAPIAFAIGAVPISDGTDGLGGLAVGVFTSLSLHASWLYAGTLLTALLVMVRRVALISRRRRRQSRQQRSPRPSPHPRSPHYSATEPGPSRP